MDVEPAGRLVRGRCPASQPLRRTRRSCATRAGRTRSRRSLSGGCMGAIAAIPCPPNPRTCATPRIAPGLDVERARRSLGAGLRRPPSVRDAHRRLQPATQHDRGWDGHRGLGHQTAQQKAPFGRVPTETVERGTRLDVGLRPATNGTTGMSYWFDSPDGKVTRSSARSMSRVAEASASGSAASGAHIGARKRARFASAASRPSQLDLERPESSPAEMKRRPQRTATAK